MASEGGWTVRTTRGSDTDVLPSPYPPSHGSGRGFVIEESLGYLVNRAARLLARQLGDRLQAHGVAIGQWAILMFLWADDGLSQAQLSRRVAIEPPTMVRTIDRMVRDGLVTRGADEADKRTSRIRLTERGRALRDTLVPEAISVNQTAAATMTAEEAVQLRRLLLRLLSAQEPG